jgi:hypothetical protein
VKVAALPRQAPWSLCESRHVGLGRWCSTEATGVRDAHGRAQREPNMEMAARPPPSRPCLEETRRGGDGQDRRARVPIRFDISGRRAPPHASPTPGWAIDRPRPLVSESIANRGAQGGIHKRASIASQPRITSATARRDWLSKGRGRGLDPACYAFTAAEIEEGTGIAEDQVEAVVVPRPLRHCLEERLGLCEPSRNSVTSAPREARSSACPPDRGNW